MGDKVEDIPAKRYIAYNRKKLDKLAEIKNLSDKQLEEIKISSLIVPFRTNNYVIDELINWDNYSIDPLFIMNFPNKQMVKRENYEKLAKLVREGSSTAEIKKTQDEIFDHINPHPGGQICYNTPQFNGKLMKGIQHKYRETVLCFPSEGQMCHAFCTYCFRWAQFIGRKDLRLAINNPNELVEYIQENEEVQEVLFTGGDPMIMKSDKLAKYVNPLLEAEINNLKTIRIGTKSLTYWPYRYVTDKDSEEVLNLFRKIVNAGIHLSIVANFNHPKELSTEVVRQAVTNIQSTGAVIRTQSPVLNHINADPDIWVELLRKEVDLGLVPYYMFIPRDTGPKEYFEVPLVKAYRIYTSAIRKLSGLCRTIRGPVMSTTPGKIHIIGITSVANKRVISLKYIQARNPKWIGRIFFSKFDAKATWLDELEPAFTKKFFYEHELAKYLGPYGFKKYPSTEEEPQVSEVAGET